jgi:hypothetical protein
VRSLRRLLARLARCNDTLAALNVRLAERGVVREASNYAALESLRRQLPRKK